MAGLKTMPPHDIAGEDLNENTSGDKWDEKLPDFIKKDYVGIRRSSGKIMKSIKKSS